MSTSMPTHLGIAGYALGPEVREDGADAFVLKDAATGGKINGKRRRRLEANRRRSGDSERGHSFHHRGR
jgi:hypothetical protein